MIKGRYTCRVSAIATTIVEAVALPRLFVASTVVVYVPGAVNVYEMGLLLPIGALSTDQA